MKQLPNIRLIFFLTAIFVIGGFLFTLSPAPSLAQFYGDGDGDGDGDFNGDIESLCAAWCQENQGSDGDFLADGDGDSIFADGDGDGDFIDDDGDSSDGDGGGDFIDGDIDSDRLWLLCSDRCGGSACNYQNEISWSDTIDDLYGGEMAYITEDNFQSWAYYYDSSDPSGDRMTLNNHFNDKQLCPSSLYGHDLLFGHQAKLDRIKEFTDMGFPIPIGIYSLDIVDGVAHSLIALSVDIWDSGFTSGMTGLTLSRYHIRVLDSNGPKISTLGCNSYEDQNGKKTSSGCSPYDGRSGGLTLDASFELAESLRATWVEKCQTNPDGTFYGVCDRHPISDWLTGNYPDISYAPLVPGGNIPATHFCSTWSEFVTRVAYLGEFRGECWNEYASASPIKSELNLSNTGFQSSDFYNSVCSIFNSQSGSLAQDGNNNQLSLSLPFVFLLFVMPPGKGPDGMSAGGPTTTTTQTKIAGHHVGLAAITALSFAVFTGGFMAAAGIGLAQLCGF